VVQTVKFGDGRVGIRAIVAEFFVAFTLLVTRGDEIIPFVQFGEGSMVGGGG